MDYRVLQIWKKDKIDEMRLSLLVEDRMDEEAHY